MIDHNNILTIFHKTIFRKDRNRSESVKYAMIKCIGGCGKTIDVQFSQLKTHSGKCRSCSKKGKPPWNLGKSNHKISGSNSPNWKGGTYISSDGYRQIKVGHRTYKREHTKTVEDFLGRPLNKGEVVHHIDGIKLNNTIDNLMPCTNSEHRTMHASLEVVAFELVRNGFIGFDKISKTYFIKGS